MRCYGTMVGAGGGQRYRGNAYGGIGAKVRRRVRRGGGGRKCPTFRDKSITDPGSCLGHLNIHTV